MKLYEKYYTNNKESILLIVNFFVGNFVIN